MEASFVCGFAVGYAIPMVYAIKGLRKWSNKEIEKDKSSGLAVMMMEAVGLSLASFGSLIIGCAVGTLSSIGYCAYDYFSMDLVSSNITQKDYADFINYLNTY